MTRIQSVFNLLKRAGFAFLCFRKEEAVRYGILFTFLFVSFAYSQDVIWVRNGETTDAHIGGLILPLGDQNNDGFDDWAVFAGGTNESALDDRLDFFHGGNPPSQTPYLSFFPRQNPTNYLNTCDVIGDFNGDGYIDWWLWYSTPEVDCVRIEIYEGGLLADTNPEQVFYFTPYEPTRTWGGSCGDHNGDGFDDIYLYDYVPSPMRDRTFLIWGNPNWETIPDLTNSAEPQLSQNTLPKSIGDINGDGYSDIISSSNPPGSQTYFYFGSELPDTIADLQWDGEFALHSTLSADLNSDGAADLAVSRDPRTIDVHLGGNPPSQTPTFVLEYEGCNNVAHGIWSAGDYNRDGYEDLVIVNDPCDNGFRRLCLFLGGPWLNANPVLEITGLSGEPFNAVPIWRSVGLGDVNGDGIDDLAIGCQGSVLDGRRGRVVILSGDTTLIVPAVERPPLAQEFSLSVYPNPANGFVNIAFEGSVYHGGELCLYNLLGERVSEIALHPGITSVNYDISPLASGVYLIHAAFGKQTTTQKLVVLK